MHWAYCMHLNVKVKYVKFFKYNFRNTKKYLLYLIRMQLLTTQQVLQSSQQSDFSTSNLQYSTSYRLDFSPLFLTCVIRLVDKEIVSFKTRVCAFYFKLK